MMVRVPPWLRSIWLFKAIPSVLQLLAADFPFGLTEEAQANIAYILLNDDIVKVTRLQTEYLFRIVKGIVNIVLSEERPLSDDLASVLTHILTCKAEKAELIESGWYYKTYCYVSKNSIPNIEDVNEHAEKLSKKLILHEYDKLLAIPPSRPLTQAGLITLRECQDLAGGATGCSTWAAGVILAEWILQNPSFFQGRRLLEVGCGSGLLGICLALAGVGLSVTLTDGNEDALENARHNLNLNGVHISTEPEELFEGPSVALKLLPWEGSAGGLQADVVLGSDLAYDPDMIDELFSFLRTIFIQNSPDNPQATCGKLEAPAEVLASRANKTGSQVDCIAILATRRRQPSTFELLQVKSEVYGLCIEPIASAKFTSSPSYGFLDALEPEDREMVVLHKVTLSTRIVEPGCKLCQRH